MSTAQHDWCDTTIILLVTVFSCDAQEDPTVLGYNLLNEPRCNCFPKIIDPSTGLSTEDAPGSDCSNIQTCTTDVQAWVTEMAAFVKSIAPNQLLGVGDEAFATFLNDADSTSLVGTNPGGPFFQLS